MASKHSTPESTPDRYVDNKHTPSVNATCKRRAVYRPTSRLLRLLSVELCFFSSSAKFSLIVLIDLDETFVATKLKQ